MKTLITVFLVASIVPSVYGLDRNITIVNQTGVDITGIYASSRANQKWGSNRLQASLQKGYQIMLDMSDGSGACIMDVLLTLSNRREFRAFAIDVCQASQIVATPQNANLLPATFVNRTAGTIRYLHVGGTGWWSEDLLGPGISLATDSSMRRDVRSPSGCLFNVRAVYWDESDYVMENVDLCSKVTVEIAHNKY